MKAIQEECNVTVQAIINDKFQEALDALRSTAMVETKDLDSSVTRLMQVEEYLARHLNRLQPTSVPKP